MTKKIDQNTVFRISDDLISKKIEDQVVIVPLIGGVGNLEDEMFQLNATGTAFWNLLDGKKNLADIISALCKEYNAPFDAIKDDILVISRTLLRKNFIVPVDLE